MAPQSVKRKKEILADKYLIFCYIQSIQLTLVMKFFDDIISRNLTLSGYSPFHDIPP